MNLYRASTQWITRPPDERFATVQELHKAAKYAREHSHETVLPLGQLGAIGHDDDDEVVIQANGNRARPTHWCFEQLALRLGAPPDYLRQLPSALAARLLNHGFKANRDALVKTLLLQDPAYEESGQSSLPLTSPPLPLLRAATGVGYTRIWDEWITGPLLDSEEQGWRVPPARPAFPGQPGTRPATEADVLRAGQFGLSIKVGDLIAPAGLYLGDRSFFAFMIREDRRIEDGSPGGLSRGFFVWNSEVGSASFGIDTFLFRHVCGNHIVWDVAGVQEIRLRHTGDSDQQALELLRRLFRRYAEYSAAGEEEQIEAAKRYSLGRDRKEVIAYVTKQDLPALTRVRGEQAWKLAESHTDTDGPPTSAWGFAQGLTRLAQTIPFTEARVTLERSAGRILMLATR